MNLAIIVAMAQNRVIGINNKMPWHIKSDLANFRAITLNKVIIMGRKTFDSLGRPLPHRTNIVISHHSYLKIDGAMVVNSLDEALSCARRIQERDINIDDSETMIIGGAQIYEQAINMAKRLYVTLVHAKPEGDALFPRIDNKIWIKSYETLHLKEQHDDHDYTFIVYDRRKTNAPLDIN